MPQLTYARSWTTTLIVCCIVGCAQNSPAPHKTNVSSATGSNLQEQKRPSQKSSNTRELLSYEDLLQVRLECTNREKLIESLEDQIRSRNFYMIDGVAGNDHPDRFSKKYFSLARYKIWNLRLGCQGSYVSKSTQENLKELKPLKPPLATPRCYFKEETIIESSVENSSPYSDTFVNRRNEICTTYPSEPESVKVDIGSLVDPKQHLDTIFSLMPNPRRWNGNVFQLAGYTEIHRGQVIKFTIVLMWTKTGWLVVDKF